MSPILGDPWRRLAPLHSRRGADRRLPGCPGLFAGAPRWAGTALALTLTLAAGALPSGSRAGEPLPPADEVIEVRAPRAEVAGDRTASATVVRAERFAGEAKDVAALVATAPGVAVQEYGGLGQFATVSVRGSMSSGVLVILDGIPLENASGGGVDLASIPRHWIERVEVVRGAEGAHYGAGALAGVVNVITRRPRAGAWEAEASGGSFGTGAASLSGSAARGAWTGLSALSGDGSEGRFPYLFDPQPSLPGTPLSPATREHNGAWRGGLLLKASGPAAGGQLDLLAQLSAGHRQLAGWPYRLTPRDAQDDRRALLAVRVSGLSLGGAELAVGLRARADALDVSIAPAPGSLRQVGRAAGAQGELGIDHAGGRLRAALTSGAEALSGPGPGGDHQRVALGLGLSDDLRLGDRLRLGPALRADVAGPFAGLSAKLGVSLAIRGDLALRASAGQSFRPPSLAELHLQQGLVQPNPALASERSAGGDAALVYDGPLGLLSLGGFAQLYRNLIVVERTSFDRLTPVNMGKALVGGLEAELATAPAPRLLGASLSASYTYLLTRNLRGDPSEVGHDLPFRARHRLFARAGVAPGPLDLHAEAHYVGRQYSDPAGTRAIGAALAWNAGGSVRLLRRPELRLHLEVKNLADDRTLLDGLGNPLPGRMAMVTLRAWSATSSATEGLP